jgi:hypothetical protein
MKLPVVAFSFYAKKKKKGIINYPRICHQKLLALEDGKLESSLFLAFSLLRNL